jgi:hypothetical protein
MKAELFISKTLMQKSHLTADDMSIWHLATLQFMAPQQQNQPTCNGNGLMYNLEVDDVDFGMTPLSYTTFFVL